MYLPVLLVSAEATLDVDASLPVAASARATEEVATVRIGRDDAPHLMPRRLALANMILPDRWCLQAGHRSGKKS